MRLLVLGGTQFVGRHIVETALGRGHEVTLFHRGKTQPGLFPQAKEVLGDRNGGLGALDGGTWDAVIDVNGYVPRLVRDSARFLSASAGRYIFISTLSVLADHTSSGQDESAARASFANLSTEEITGETYGPLKAACEAVVEDECAGKSAILRPGFIVGPWDHTGRFLYWIRRATEGGTMVGPGSPDAPIQFIDARDLAVFAIHVAEKGNSGTYHTVGPKAPWTWGALFEEARRLTRLDTSIVWVRAEFLESLGLPPGSLPMWYAGADGLARTDCRKAIAAGLTFRPAAETIRDALQWDTLHGRRDVGLSPEREREILAAWERASL